MLRPKGPAMLIAALLAPAAAAQTIGDPAAGQAIAVGDFEGGAAGACQSCHGIDGAGDAAGGFPRLSGLPPLYLDKALQDFAAGRRQDEIMTPIARALSAAQRRDVSAYYARTVGAMASLDRDVAPDLLQEAAVISSIGSSAEGVQGCINCHGPNGQGMGVQYPPLAGQSAVYLRQQLEDFKAGRRSGDTAGVMRGIAGRLTDRQIEGLALYFSVIPAIFPQDATASAVIVEESP